MDIRIERLTDLPLDSLAALVAESEQGGWRFVSRLGEEWAAGGNRFDRPGEALFGAWADGGAKTATERAGALWRETLASFQPPPTDPQVLEALTAFVARRRNEGGAPPVS